MLNIGEAILSYMIIYGAPSGEVVNPLKRKVCRLIELQPISR